MGGLVIPCGSASARRRVDDLCLSWLQPKKSAMNRRKFLRVSAAGMALSAIGNYAAEFADQKKRVGLIGCGWYGKADLFRLIQVAPVEVVSLCDVDKRMLADAAEMVAARQLSKKQPRTYADYRA